MIEINRFTLENGLRVVHSRSVATQMAAVNLLYKVGSKNESSNHTGLAHFLEHLMFGGSENVRFFDRTLQDVGGENNAWTTYDLTNYYEVLPVENIETAFWVESDRMSNLLLSDKSIEVQRSVVMEEFKQRCLNSPYGDVSHLWRPMVYRQHPYGWPVIGKTLEHIQDMPKDIIEGFYHRYYSPRNAILSIVADIEADAVFCLAEKWFGGIGGKSESETLTSAIIQEPAQSGYRETCVKRSVPHNLLVRAYRMCDRLSPDYQTCDLISDILSNGRSSRFYRNIYAKRQLVSSIDASITGDMDTGCLRIKAQLLPNVSFDAVEAAIDEELEAISGVETSEWEIDKNVNRFESNLLFSNINNDEKASNLAYYEMLGDADMINSEVDKYRSIKSAKIAEVASRLFKKSNCSTLYYEAK